MVRAELPIKGQFFSPDTGRTIAGTDSPVPPVYGRFDKPGYFDKGTSPQMQERLEAFVQNPYFRDTTVDLDLPATSQLLQSYCGVQLQVAEELVLRADEQNVIMLRTVPSEDGSSSLFCDRLNLVILAMFFTTPRNITKLVKTRDFMPFVPGVLDELGDHELHEDLEHLIEVDDSASLLKVKDSQQVPLRTSPHFAGYNFPDGSGAPTLTTNTGRPGSPKNNRYLKRLKEKFE